MTSDSYFSTGLKPPTSGMLMVDAWKPVQNWRLEAKHTKFEKESHLNQTSHDFGLFDVFDVHFPGFFRGFGVNFDQITIIA